MNKYWLWVEKEEEKKKPTVYNYTYRNLHKIIILYSYLKNKILKLGKQIHAKKFPRPEGLVFFNLSSNLIASFSYFTFKFIFLWAYISWLSSII